MPTPVILPELDITNAGTYDGTQDVELTVDGVDGLKMTVKAGSMRRADGSAPSPADPAILSLDQVHHDDVPMPMPDGVSPPFAWTLQPAGATFDPPIQIEYPNMTGLPAGSISYFLSFNHDTNRFEIVATGTVSEDGSTIISDPGVGISVAGWGCNCPPYAVAGACINCAVDCLETGSLSEGEGTVDKSLVCVGESVTFSVTTDSVDNGGIKQFNCPDSTVTDFDGPVAPTYSWVISGPGNPVSGNGNTVTFTPPTNGTYSCQFTASANRDCPPDPVTFNGGSVNVADVTSITSSENVVCVDESVTFTANGGPFPPGKPTWIGDGSPGSGSGSSFTTSWSTPGIKTVTAKCLGAGMSTTVKVVEVESLIAKGIASTAQTPANAEEVLVCLGSPGATIPITAAPNPNPFPSGEPKWSTGESGVTSIDFPIDVAGTFPVSASCNTSTRHIKIVPVDVQINADDVFCVNQPNETASITGVPAGVTVNLNSTNPGKVQFSPTSVTGSGTVDLIIGSQPSNAVEDITLQAELPDGSVCFEKKVTVFHIESNSGVLCVNETQSFLSDLEPSGPPLWVSTVAEFMNFLPFDTVKVTDPSTVVSDVITGFAFLEDSGQLKIQVTSGNNPEDVLMRFKLFGVQLHQEHMTTVKIGPVIPDCTNIGVGGDMELSTGIQPAGRIITWIIDGDPLGSSIISTGSIIGQFTAGNTDGTVIIKACDSIAIDCCSTETVEIVGACESNENIIPGYENVPGGTPNCGGDNGLFQEINGAFEFDFNACYDATEDHWTVQIDNVIIPYHLQVCDKTTSDKVVNSASDPAVDETSYCEILENFKPSIPFEGTLIAPFAPLGTYYPKNCIQQHEERHLEVWRNLVDGVWIFAEEDIENNITIPFSCGDTPSTAHAQFLNDGEVQNRIATAVAVAFTNTNIPTHEQSGANDVENACLQELRDEIQNRAVSEGWNLSNPCP